MADMPKNLVPARYIGAHPVELAPGRPHYNIDGTRRGIEDNTLAHGDTIMMVDEDVLGKTILEDPHAVKDPVQLGIGRVILPEHAGKSLEELDQLGYVFHQGRGDFRALADEQAIEPPGVEGSLQAPAIEATETPALVEPPAQHEEGVI
jgi:hypothetical protein